MYRSEDSKMSAVNYAKDHDRDPTLFDRVIEELEVVDKRLLVTLQRLERVRSNILGPRVEADLTKTAERQQCFAERFHHMSAEVNARLSELDDLVTFVETIA